MPKNLKSGFTLVEIMMIGQLPVIAILAPQRAQIGRKVEIALQTGFCASLEKV